MYGLKLRANAQAKTRCVHRPVFSFGSQTVEVDKTRLEWTGKRFGVITPRSLWFGSELLENGRHHTVLTSKMIRSDRQRPTNAGR